MNISSDNRYNIPVTVIRSNRKTVAIEKVATVFCYNSDPNDRPHKTLNIQNKSSRDVLRRILFSYLTFIMYGVNNKLQAV